MQAFSSLPATIAIQNHFGGGDANSLMASAFKTNAQLIAINNNNNDAEEEVSRLSQINHKHSFYNIKNLLCSVNNSCYIVISDLA